MGTVYLKSPEETGAFFSRGGVLFLYVVVCYAVETQSNACIVPSSSLVSLLWPKFLPCSTSGPSYIVSS